MTSFEELAEKSFQIIANVGDARSCYLEAVQAAKAGDFDLAQQRMRDGEDMFRKGHAAHTELVQREAGGDPVNMTLMITHAEDQLMSAEAFGILAEEFIDVYRRMDGDVAGRISPADASGVTEDAPMASNRDRVS